MLIRAMCGCLLEIKVDISVGSDKAVELLQSRISLSAFEGTLFTGGHVRNTIRCHSSWRLPRKPQLA